MSVIPFGKHAGREIGEIPSGYLLWFVQEVKDQDELVQEAEEELEYRTETRSHFYD